MPLLQQAAELGESDALAYLGAAFMEGWAVARDEAKAVAYLTCVEVNQMRRRWRAT